MTKEVGAEAHGKERGGGGGKSGKWQKQYAQEKQEGIEPLLRPWLNPSKKGRSSTTILIALDRVGHFLTCLNITPYLVIIT